MLKSLLEKLICQKNLTKEESALAIDQILADANPNQIAAFLVLMRAKGETVEELQGIIEAMRTKMIQIQIPTPVLDIVGTGGDGAHTLNISTASAILAASCGVKIAKHGNRSVSSACGSADVLEWLGINIHQGKENLSRCIEEVGIGFMFAPNFHPAIKNLKEIRAGLNIRSFFNIIGPLLNPAHAQYLMVGVFHKDLMEKVASLLCHLKIHRALVFHGCGLDELSCLGPSDVIEVSENSIRHFVLDPIELGLKQCTLDDLRGKDAAYNAHRIVEALEGKQSPFADTIALNAGVAAYIYGITDSIVEGIEMAKIHLKEKRGLNLLSKWRSYV